MYYTVFTTWHQLLNLLTYAGIIDLNESSASNEDLDKMILLILNEARGFVNSVSEINILNLDFQIFKDESYQLSQINSSIYTIYKTITKICEQITKDLRFVEHYKIVKKGTGVIKLALTFMPSCSRLYYKLAEFISKQGKYKSYQDTLKYIGVSLHLAPNNQEYQKLFERYQKLSTERLNVIKLKQLSTSGNDLPLNYYEDIGRNHIESNKHQFQSRLFQIDPPSLGMLKSLKTPLLMKIPNRNISDKFILCLQYYEQGLHYLNVDNNLEMAFKSFWNSIIIGDIENDSFIGSFYQLGIMYENGNEYVAMNIPLAIHSKLSNEI